MTSTSPKLPPLPGPDVPVILPNQTVNPDWYLWLKTNDAIVRRLREEV